MAGRQSSLVLLVLALSGIDAARILAYFPSPAVSSQQVFRPLTQELARRGHEVIFITTDPGFPKGKAPANLTEIDFHDISYEVWRNSFTFNKEKKSDVLTDTTLIYDTLNNIFDVQMETPELKEIMKKDKNYFDVLLLEGYHRPLLAMAHKFDAPVIHVSPYGGIPMQYADVGAPTHPIVYPFGEKLYNLTLIEKTFQLFTYMTLEHEYSGGEYETAIMRKHFGKDVPSYEELKHRVKMLFLNEHPFWGDNRPVPPNVIYMGGIHVPKVKDLPKDLKQYLDSSKHGVIYVSFGTNVLASLLPPEKIMIMTKALSELPYDVLWKWDNDTLPGQTKNIKVSKWFPQADLLKHPNVKLFVTQGGLQSTDEAIDATVPLIGIPMLGDQWYNVEKYYQHRMGMQFDIKKLNEKDFKEAVNTVIHDKSYKNNMIRIRGIMRDNPIDPLNLTAWWTEHVIKYGGDHLKSPAALMSWIEYYEVKLVLLILSIFVVCLLLLAYTIKSVLSSLTRIIVKQKNE